MAAEGFATVKSRLIPKPGNGVLVVVCDKGDDAVDAVTEAVRRFGVRAGQITGVGGFRRCTVGYFDSERRDYHHVVVDDQVEVLSLLGDVASDGEDPQVHMHVVLGRRNGAAMGGHLLRGEVWPTLEVLVTEVDAELVKRYDRETGLMLLAAGR